MANETDDIRVKDEIGLLRTEIIESQKARIDLLKFKLIAVAALGSVGLGLGEYHSWLQEGLDVILCIIPFVCIYIDFLCYHNTMRILVIGQFLAFKNDGYEIYISELGGNNKKYNGAGYYFELEDFSLEWSSVLLSALLSIYGVYIANDRALFDFKVLIFSIPILFSLVLVYFLKPKFLRLNNKIHKNFPDKLKRYTGLIRRGVIMFLVVVFMIIGGLFFSCLGVNKGFVFFLIGSFSVVIVFLGGYFYDRHKDNLFKIAKEIQDFHIS